MTLLVLGDSQVSRVWSAVKANRECLRTGSYEAVKNRDAIMPALGGIGEKVCIRFIYLFIWVARLILRLRDFFTMDFYKFWIMIYRSPGFINNYSDLMRCLKV